MKLLFSLIIALLVNLCLAKASIDKRLEKLYMKLSECSYTVTSGYRTKKHNKKVGGAPNSYHLYDRARDITSTKECRDDLGKAALQEGLTVIYYNKHIHVDDREEAKCLIKVKNGFRDCNNLMLRTRLE